MSSALQQIAEYRARVALIAKAGNYVSLKVGTAMFQFQPYRVAS